MHTAYQPPHQGRAQHPPVPDDAYPPALKIERRIPIMSTRTLFLGGGASYRLAHSGIADRRLGASRGPRLGGSVVERALELLLGHLRATGNFAAPRFPRSCRAVLFLASDESGWVTGSMVTVEGGYLTI